MAEKAQHDPHEPWFLTGVTAFYFLQSTEVGFSVIEIELFHGHSGGPHPFINGTTLIVDSKLGINPSIFLNSASV